MNDCACSLIKALYAAGRQAEALEAYARARRYLIDEVGLEPGAELRAVEAAVLSQDSTLVPAPYRPRGGAAGAGDPAGGARAGAGEVAPRALGSPAYNAGRPRWGGQDQAHTRAPGSAILTRGRSVVRGTRQCSDDADVASTVARTLQLAESPGHEIDLVCDYLSRRRGLLVLDTCERVVEGAAELAAAVLVRCTDLQVLTTRASPC